MTTLCHIPFEVDEWADKTGLHASVLLTQPERLSDAVAGGPVGHRRVAYIRQSVVTGTFRIQYRAGSPSGWRYVTEPTYDAALERVRVWLNRRFRFAE